MAEDIELNGMRRGDCEPHHHGHRHGCGRPMVVLERDMPEDLAAAVKQVQSAAKAVEEMARIKTKGSDGKSAYDLYVEKGGELTLEEWLESLHGRDADIAAAETATTAANEGAAAANAATASAIAAETTRQQTFDTNETARQTAAQNAETFRNGAYEEAENDRDEEFATNEAHREATFNANEAGRTASVQAAQTAAQAAATSAAVAEQKATAIDEAISGIDPSQSADDAIVAEAATRAAKDAELESTLDQLGPKIDGGIEYGASSNIDFSSGTIRNCYINVNEDWVTHSTSTYLFVETSGGKLHVVPNENGARLFFAKIILPYSNVNKSNLISTYLATYDTGTDKIYYDISSETTLDIPSDANVIGFLRTTTTGIDRLPTSAQMPKYAIYKSSVRDDIDYIANVIGSMCVLPLIEEGAIASATGIPSSSTTRLRTKTFIKASAINVSVGASAKYYVFGYDANGVYVAADSSSWRTTSAKVSIGGCSMYKIVFAYTDDSTISSSDFETLGVEITIEDSEGKKVITKSDVVNDISVGGSDVPLSAEAGKGLNTQINGEYTQLNLSSYQQYAAIIATSDNKWHTSDISNIYCLLIPVSAGETYFCKANANTSTSIAFLRTSTITHLATPSFVSGTSRIPILANETLGFVIPEGGKFLYVTISYAGDRSPQYLGILTSKGIRQEVDEIKQGINVSLDKKDLVYLASIVGNKLNPSTYQLDENGYEVPMTRQQMFAIWKSEQLSSIKWTPLLDVPKPGGGSFTAGVEVTGLPYSSTKEIDKYVGFDVSIHTFMTAVNNPYSLLYTENISAANSQSAWGKTYHGGGPNPARTYYGVVCSVFAAYCSGLLQQWSTDEDAWLRNYKLKFSKNYDQSAQGLMIGDIYWRNGHNRVIAGLKRDASGNVTHVYVSEAVTPTVGVTLYTAAQFDAKTASENGVLYRNLELYKNKYTPSEFVAAGDESVPSPTYNDDICTFAGDKATFREGDIIVIDYNLKSVGSWTQMELYKDDLLIDTITIYTSFHYVNLTSRNLSYGRYKARMKNGNGNVSDFTYWEIIQADVAIQTNDNDTHTISWTSANGKALSIIVCDISGIVYAHDEFSEEVTNDNSITIDLYKLNREQYPSDKFASSGMYLKVSFVGQYGRVTNEPIEISL